MQILVYVIVIVYLLSINLYGIILLHYQKKSITNPAEENTISNGKIFLTGLIGGALGIFIFMFIFKYKLKSMLMMITMPLFVALTVFLVIILFNSGITLLT